MNHTAIYFTVGRRYRKLGSSLPDVYAGMEDAEHLVRTVLAARGPRETLLLPLSASASEAKTAFRQLALRLHPDKCNSLHAEEAFRKAHDALLQLQPHAEQTSRCILLS